MTDIVLLRHAGDPLTGSWAAEVLVDGESRLVSFPPFVIQVLADPILGEIAKRCADAVKLYREAAHG